MFFFDRKTRARKPTNYVGVDRSNPTGKKLYAAFLLNERGNVVRDLCSHKVGTLTNGNLVAKQSTVQFTSTTTEEITIPEGYNLGLMDTWAVFSYAKVSSANGPQEHLFATRGLSGEEVFLRRKSWATTLELRYTINSVAADCIGTSNIRDGAWHSMLGQKSNSAGLLEVGVDGIIEASLSSTATKKQTYTQGAKIGAAHVNNTHDWEEEYSVLYLFKEALTENEFKKLSANPYFVLQKEETPVFIPDVAGGITGTGSLSSAAATMSGTGERAVTGTGALASTAATMSGAGQREITSSGALASQAASIAGSGTVGTVITGTGALASAIATMSGAGQREITGSGSLVAAAATMTGSGTVAGNITGTGALASQAAAMAGTGEVEHTGTGALVAAAATIAGSGAVSGVVSGTGALAAQAATMAGSGTTTSITPYIDQVIADGASILYNVDERIGESVATDSIGTADATYAGSPTLEVTGLVANDTGTCVTLSRGTSDHIVMPVSANPAANADRAIEAVFKLAARTNGNAYFLYMNHDNTGGLDIESLYVDTAGKLRYKVVNTGGTAFYAVSTTTITAGVKYHMAAVMDSVNGMSIILDGIEEDTDTNTSTSTATPEDLFIGVDDTGTSHLGGEIDAIAFYDTSPSVATFLAHSDAVATGGLYQRGVLAAQSATMAGSGTVGGFHTGTGSLASAVATMAGVGEISHVGTGALAANDATMSGSGTASATVTGTGALASAAATMAGTGTVPVSVTIDGAASATITTANGTLVLYGSGTEYFTLEDRVLLTY